MLLRRFRHAWSKPVFSDPSQVVAKFVRPKQTLLLGGFGLCGIPELMIKAMVSATGPTLNNLTVVSNDTG